MSLLRRRFNPQQVSSVTLRKEGVSISRKAIYGFISRNKGQNLEGCLRRGRIRVQRRRSGTTRTSIPDYTDIEMWSSTVNDRKRYGDLECGRIEGTRQWNVFFALNKS